MHKVNDIKLICFDLDETVIEGISWRGLNLAWGVTSTEDQDMRERYHHHKTLSYEDWVTTLLKMFKERGLANRANATEALSKYKYRDGVKEIVGYLKDKGYHLALISGAVDIIVDLIAKDLGIELAAANSRLIFDENDHLDKIVSEDDGLLGKLNYLESFCRRLGIDITECACIGDGINDLEMFRKTKRGITFIDSPIKEEAWKVISHFSEIREFL